MKGNTLNQDKIARIEVSLPPLDVQERIASVLSELQRTIDLAQQRTDTLRTLFASVRYEVIVHSLPRVDLDEDAE